MPTACKPLAYSPLLAFRNWAAPDLFYTLLLYHSRFFSRRLWHQSMPFTPSREDSFDVLVSRIQSVLGCMTLTVRHSRFDESYKRYEREGVCLSRDRQVSPDLTASAGWLSKYFHFVTLQLTQAASSIFWAHSIRSRRKDCLSVLRVLPWPCDFDSCNLPTAPSLERA